jgi:hypothetical protein
MIVAFLLALVLTVSTADEPAWSTAAVVRQGSQPVVRFQARIDGDYLFVRATHEKEWHTYAMDNEARGLKTLQGRTSLGIEQGVAIGVKSGLEMDAPWLQTRPRDLSKPELRWYTYGFDQTAIFACRIKTVTSAPVVVRVRGQACSGESCRNIDVVLELGECRVSDEQTPQQAERVKTMLQDLVPVAKRPPETAGKP